MEYNIQPGRAHPGQLPDECICYLLFHALFLWRLLGLWLLGMRRTGLTHITPPSFISLLDLCLYYTICVNIASIDMGDNLHQENYRTPDFFPTVALTAELGGFILGKKGLDRERESSEPGDSKKQMGLPQSGAGGHPSRFLIQG
jgi:hypothetical protein